MKILFFILFLPFIGLTQQLSEFQLIKYDKTFIKDYDFEGGLDSLKSDRHKYELLTTNLGINNGVCKMLNDWLKNSNKDTFKLNTKWSDKSILDFAIYQSGEIADNVILRQFGEGLNCYSCSISIFDILIEDPDVLDILQNKKIKYAHASYFQITFDGEPVMSYINFYYKLVGEKKSAIILYLPNDME